MDMSCCMLSPHTPVPRPSVSHPLVAAASQSSGSRVAAAAVSPAGRAGALTAVPGRVRASRSAAGRRAGSDAGVQ